MISDPLTVPACSGGSTAADRTFDPVTAHLPAQPFDGNPDFVGPFAGPCNLVRPFGDLKRSTNRGTPSPPGGHFDFYSNWLGTPY